MSEPQDEEPIETPPEGASCGEHPERDALVTCPRCGSFCCISCWHNTVRLCHACLLRDPGPTVPWEDRARSLAGRFFVTLADALRPSRSAPSFVRSEWRAAIPFALLTFVPLAIVSGIIPYTHTLGFGGGAVELLGSPDAAGIALDVARASLLGLVVSGGMLACIAVPYYSLSRAYAAAGNRSAALSLMAYRGWLIPLGELVLAVLIWVMPLEPTEGAKALALAASLVPLLVLLFSMLATARIASGVGPVATLVVVLVPIILMMTLTPLGKKALAPFMPEPPPSSAPASRS